MTRVVILLLLGCAASVAFAQQVPAELAALAAKSGVSGPVTAWCRGEFRSGRPGAFAAAVPAAAGGGRYIVLDADGTVAELGSFSRGADLSCYSRAEAEKLDVAISQSDTIHGHITPRWNTTVVCAFLDETTAACWQYSPLAETFVTVGRWVT